MDTILMIIVGILILVLAVLLLYIIACAIDQAFAPESFAGNARVVNKDEGTRITHITVGKVFIPQSHPYWEITYHLDGQEISSDIDEEDYPHIRVGQKIGVNVRKGLISTEYYPIC